MSSAKPFFLLPVFVLLGLRIAASGAVTEEAHAGHPVMEAVISVVDQRMAVLEDGGLIKRFPVSTSRFGVGDGCGTYKTPLGRLKVCEKLGEQLPVGSVIRHRQATGEVLAANAPGRDPIVTRVIWLEGCEGQNANARERSIYIHGTVEESKIGKPVSWGCIRMRSEDVIALFDELPVGAMVTIVNEKLPHYPKYVAPKPEPPRPEMLVAKQETKPSPAAATRSAATAARAATPEPTPIAERETKENPRRATVATAAPEVAPVKERRAIEVVSTAPARKGNDLTQSLRSSILVSGLGDGNSEIPQLRQ